MGIKLNLGIKSYEKPEKIELPFGLRYNIYDLSDAEWGKLQDMIGNLKSFMDGLNKKQTEAAKKKKEEWIKKKQEWKKKKEKSKSKN